MPENSEQLKESEADVPEKNVGFRETVEEVDVRDDASEGDVQEPSNVGSNPNACVNLGKLDDAFDITNEEENQSQSCPSVISDNSTL